MDHRVEVRMSKDEWYRWLLVNGKDETVALGVGRYERPEEAERAGGAVLEAQQGLRESRMALVALGRKHSKAKADIASLDRKLHREAEKHKEDCDRLAKELHETRECRDDLKMAAKTLRGQRDKYYERLGTLEEELRGTRERRDKYFEQRVSLAGELASVRKVCAAESAKVSAGTHSVAVLERRVAAMRSSRVLWAWVMFAAGVLVGGVLIQLGSVL